MSCYSQSSNLLNQARLRVLKARDEHVSNVLNDSKSKLGDITKDQQKYSQLLQGLIAQVRSIEFYNYNTIVHTFIFKIFKYSERKY